MQGIKGEEEKEVKRRIAAGEEGLSGEKRGHFTPPWGRSRGRKEG